MRSRVLQGRLGRPGYAQWNIRSSGPGLCRTSRSRWSCLGQGRLWQIDSWVVLALPSWVLFELSRECTIELEAARNSQTSGQRWDCKGVHHAAPTAPASGAHPLRGGAPPGASCLLLPSWGPETDPPLQAPGPMEPHKAVPAGPAPYGKGRLGFAVVSTSTAPRAHSGQQGGRRAP